MQIFKLPSVFEQPTACNDPAEIAVLAMVITRVEAELSLDKVLIAVIIDPIERTLVVSTRDASFIDQQVNLRVDIDRDPFSTIPS